MRAKLVRLTAKGYPGHEPVVDDDFELDNFTLGKYYEVFCMQQSLSACFLTLIDDNDFFSTRLAFHFELESNEIPKDWKINLISGSSEMTLGPQLITQSLEVYDKMIDYDPEIMKRIQAYYTAKSEETQ